MGKEGVLPSPGLVGLLDRSVSPWSGYPAEAGGEHRKWEDPVSS